MAEGYEGCCKGEGDAVDGVVEDAPPDGLHAEEDRTTLGLG